MCCFGRRQCASNDIMRLYLVQCVRVCAPHSARLRRPDVMAVLYAPGRRAVLKAGWSARLAADSLVVGCRLQPNPARMTPAATPSSSYPRHPIPSRPVLDVSSEQLSLPLSRQHIEIFDLALTSLYCVFAASHVA